MGWPASRQWAVAKRDHGLDHLFHRVHLILPKEEPIRNSATSLMTAERGSTVLTRIPVPPTPTTNALVRRLSAAFEAPNQR
jgi:hypothetical protein